jgi:16S rRNA (uracil1498-N3)-methyltransferase
MSLPYFYIDQLDINPITLDEDTSKHMISVLRMQNGDEILLTDGRGTKARSVIIDDNRKKCKVDILSKEIEHEPIRKVTIAISITKNTSRFEWFLEKATEIGVNEIIPLIWEISAMLQSQQCWLPVLHEPFEFKNSIEMDYEKKLIAHCLPEQKKPLNDPGMKAGSSIILIGPEGDFTPLEIQKALQHNFIPVTLGNTRLRTETAGIAASVILCIG